MKRNICVRVCAWLMLLGGAVYATSQLTACNTVKGAGEDVQSAGEGISGAAEGAQHHD